MLKLGQQVSGYLIKSGFDFVNGYDYGLDKVTFLCVIKTCSALATLGQGQQVLAEAVKSGADASVSVRSSHISLLRFGCFGRSCVKVFTEPEDDDDVWWSSVGCNNTAFVDMAGTDQHG
ncbi:hypothetical protein IFM89_003646 [Coptis chinensis]|uniref:Uncharacterized protein n=1 Tax=Coptis chinensis TaxID=261450 RepID=A0A835IUH8_9MAGN|nr:hypothetical protein IFM89_003646 [Coptis chinensis]